MATPSRSDNLVVEDVPDALERIAELNPTLNAFISVFEAEAMARRDVLDEELRQGDREARCMAARFPSRISST